MPLLIFFGPWYGSVVLFVLLTGFVLILMQPFPLADLAFAGLLAVNVLKDNAKDVRVPFDGTALNTFLNVLQQS